MLKIGIVAQKHDEIFGVHTNYLEWGDRFGYSVTINPVYPKDFYDVYNIDALILPGGSDLFTDRFGQKPGYSTGNPNQYLEWFDKNILPTLIGEIPIFGICRGLQTLNVLFGGTLVQDLQYHPYSTYENHTVHKVYIPGEKKHLMEVNSFHHQGIDKLAPNFVKELDAHDGVIEAISDYDNNIFAVQWHPERLLDRYSIQNFHRILK